METLGYISAFYTAEKKNHHHDFPRFIIIFTPKVTSSMETTTMNLVFIFTP